MSYNTNDIFALIDELAPAMGVDASTAKMIIGAEQVFKDKATGGFRLPEQFSPRASNKDARGVGQVIPSTEAALKKQGYLPADFVLGDDPKSQVIASLATIKEMAPRAGGDPLRLAAMYNGGTAAGKAYGTDKFAQAPQETQVHVQKAKYVMDTLNTDDQSAAETLRTQRGAPPVPPAGGGTSALGTDNMLKNLTDSFHSFGQSAGEVIGAIRGYQSEADAGLEASVAQAAAQSVAEQQVAAARIQANGILQTRKDAVNTMFQLTDTDVGAMRDEYVSIESKRRALEEQVSEQLSVGFFDNPLQYLANLTTLPGLVNQHNSLAAKSNNINKELATRQDLSAKQQAVTAANVTEQFAKEQTAAADIAAAKAQADVAKLRTENAATNAKNLIQIMQTQGQQVSTGAQIASTIRMELRQDQEFAKLDKAKQEDIVDMQATNKMLAPIGAVISPAEWKHMTATQKLPLIQMRTRGSYGNNLAESYEVITGSNLYNRQRADKGMALVIDTVSDQLPARMREIQTKDVTGKLKPDDIKRQALATIEAEWKSAAQRGTDRERVPAGNPYNIDYNFILLSGREKGTFIGNALSSIAQKNMVGGAVAAKFDNIADEALIEIANKKTTPGQAAQKIADFYQKANEESYKMRGLSFFNMPQAEGYTVYPQGAQRDVDLTNPAKVELYLTLRSQQVIRNQLMMNYLSHEQSPVPYMPGAPVDLIDGPRGQMPAPVRKN